MGGTSHHAPAGSGPFPSDISGLPATISTQTLVLDDGDGVELRIAPVAHAIGADVVRMLAYGGSIPGPTLRVRQGTEIVVDVVNDGDVDATVHWHGLRLENRFDGVPHDTQRPIPVGASFRYRVRFPDVGLYWYHPHVREDYTQDMGLYGSIVVEPRDPTYWAPADREVVLTVDDVLLEEGRIAPYDRSVSDHVAMGRFGNVLLVNGLPAWSLDVQRGEVVRCFLTNTANTRVFNLGVAGAVTKLVGGDSGRYEREAIVDEVLIAPSERAIVDVLFDREGEAVLEHRTPDRTYELGRVVVAGEASTAATDAFHVLRRFPELEAERARLVGELRREPDRTLALVAEMSLETGEPPDADVPDAFRFACPMDPEVVSVEPGRCPTCGMKLLPIEFVPAALERLRGDGHAGSQDSSHDGSHGERAGHAAGSIEWEDTMEEINRQTTSSNMRWMLVDRATGRRNGEIDWTFAVGDRVKIRLVNEMDSDHPMHHPFHVHGAGRFLVLARDDQPETNLVWKDTVLVRTGEVVDVLLDVTNPGLWMAHCHIAEHIEDGMMFSFLVTP